MLVGKNILKDFENTSFQNQSLSSEQIEPIEQATTEMPLEPITPKQIAELMIEKFKDKSDFAQFVVKLKARHGL